MNTEIIILASNPESFRRHPNLIASDVLWQEYLQKVCRCRGKVFFDEGLIPPDRLTKEGALIDPFDRRSHHFVACDHGQVVGALRIMDLTTAQDFVQGSIESAFQELGYRHHHEIYLKYFHQQYEQRRSILEFSRLAVDENYRLFRNIQSRVALSLLAAGYLYVLDNDIKAMFITRGNKYQTKNIYERIGFHLVMNSSGKALEPFWKYGDMNDLMFLAQEGITAEFKRLSEPFRDAYFNAKVYFPTREA